MRELKEAEDRTRLLERGRSFGKFVKLRLKK